MGHLRIPTLKGGVESFHPLNGGRKCFTLSHRYRVNPSFFRSMPVLSSGGAAI